ncbi:hypothetical protein LINGRAHAP2_LOCUS28727 [Linum grandiflorum]
MHSICHRLLLQQQQTRSGWFRSCLQGKTKGTRDSCEKAFKWFNTRT